jgi:hypothetical protein
MLGFSGITGRDAANREPTQINGLSGSEVNAFSGLVYHVGRGADNVMPVDPGHEFSNVLEQLCGSGATYPEGGAYPAINNSRFVASSVVTRAYKPRFASTTSDRLARSQAQERQKRTRELDAMALCERTVPKLPILKRTLAERENALHPTPDS